MHEWGRIVGSFEGSFEHRPNREELEGCLVNPAEPGWHCRHAAGHADLGGGFGLPANSKDAVLIVTLAPGTYFAQVTGVGSTTGVALVEIYELP